MADIKISELTTASQINNGDNIELSQDSGGGSLVSLKATILAVATKILKGINFTSDLQTTNKTIIGAINEAAQGGGGGSSSLAGLSDVDIDDQTLDDDQVLVWDSVNEKWVNADQSGQGGTTVVANPSGEATDDLLKVQIGSTIYDIPGGSISALSGKSLVMKTKTWTGDGNNPCVLTFTEKPYAIFNIFGDGLNGEKVLSSPFIYGETSYYLSSYSNGILFNSVSYSNNDLTMTMSGVDEGTVFNVNGSQYTMWYLVEETFNEFKDITGTLEAGETSITLSDADITSNSTVQPFTDVFGLNPTNMVVANGSVTLTFDAQQNDVRVKVRISSNCAVPVTNLDAEDVVYGNGNVKSALDNAFKSFDDWTLLSDFDTNNDTWIATNDGFLSVRATNVGATNGTYCYLYDTGLSSSVPISTISLPSGGGSLTYAQVIPVIKGHTYKMLMGGAISSVASYFLKINK